MVRRIASNFIRTPSGVYQQAVIELVDGYVSRIYPLVGEIYNTEWMQGMIEVKELFDGRLVAFYGYNRIE
jgi:conserved domain protein